MDRGITTIMATGDWNMRGLLAIGCGIAALAGQLFAAPPVGPYFNGVFPVLAPGSASGWTTENAFPNLTFVDPLWLAEIPGSNEMLVVGKSGRISRFPNDPAAMADQVTTVLDLNSSLQISEDQGLYQLIFHPQFGQAGSPHANDVFVCYNHRPESVNAAPDRSMWRVSKFIWSPASGTIDPASESVLIQQYDPHRWHNGGAMAFDNEGFLMITCGDGGGADDQFAQSQRINGGFFGGVLRIDVDNDPAKSHAISRQPLDPPGKPASFPASFSQGYGIPNTNPWVGGAVLEEFYAIGLRSPHSAHYDPVTGDLWVGDVGQSQLEELTRVRKGTNSQWPYMQGTLTGPKPKPSVATMIGTENPPFYSYDRTAGTCIIGGPRYRGSKWAADLGGRIFFGDNGKGYISTVTLNAQDGAPFITQIHSGLGPGIYSGLAGICTDLAGEIYFMKLNGQGQNGGTLRKLVRAGTYAEAPALLSATGLFADMSTLLPSSPMVAYEVASPLWSDGALKRRWMIIPNDGSHNTVAEKIAFNETGNWTFPAGTVLVKHFEIPVDERNPAVMKRLETRVMVCTTNGGKYGLTYKWNAAGTDAVLLTDGAEEEFEVTAQDGGTSTRTWSYPSRADCMQCHTEATGQALGLRTHQINRMVPNLTDGQPVNQLSLFSSNGLFSPSISQSRVSGFLQSRPLDDVTAPVEHRVRSYLDSNCSQCHQPGSSVPHFDARLHVPLRAQNLVNGIIEGQFNLGPDGRYLKPGDPALSAIHVRAASAVPGVAMPPLGKHVVDQQAVNLLQSYISGLTPEEFNVEPATSARYVRLTSLSSHSSNAMSVGELRILDGKGRPILPSELSIESFTSEEPGSAARIIDGDPYTYWITVLGGPSPKQITMDLGSVREFGGIEYTPRQDIPVGRIRGFEVHYSDNGNDWTLATSGILANVNSTFRFDGLVSKRPARCEIAGPEAPVSGPFEVVIAFDSAVTDFVAADLTVAGGVVTGLRGNGYFYTATVLAQQSTASISVAQNVANSSLLGNLASNVLEIQNIGDTGPMAQFTEVPEQTSGIFSMNIVFDRPIEMMNEYFFTATNGGILRVENTIGNAYRLVVNASGSGGVTVTLKEDLVMGTNGLPMAGSIAVTVPFGTPQLSVEAEAGLVESGFVIVQDPAASGGGYLWIPEGSRSGSTGLDPLLKVSFSVNIPRSGLYHLKGDVRADDPLSSSFYLGFDGDPAPVRWVTNVGPDEMGSGNFHPIFMEIDGTPRIFSLSAGNHVIDLYASDDGTRIDQLELVPAFPQATWIGDGSQSDLPLSGILEFSDEVTGLGIDDFNIVDGTVASVTGSGRRYRIVFSLSYNHTWVSLRAGAVTDGLGRTNPASDTQYAHFINTYAQWAKDFGADPSPAAYLLDEDNDGLSQLMEYALGLDPKIPNHQMMDPTDPQSRGLPWIRYDTTRNKLAISYLKRSDGLPLDYIPERTADLITYDSNIWELQELWPSPAWRLVTYYVDPLPSQEDRVFVRLRVQTY